MHCIALHGITIPYHTIHACMHTYIHMGITSVQETLRCFRFQRCCARFTEVVITKASLLAGVGSALAMNWGRLAAAAMIFHVTFVLRTPCSAWLIISNCDPPLGLKPRCVHPAGIRWVSSESTRLHAPTHPLRTIIANSDGECILRAKTLQLYLTGMGRWKDLRIFKKLPSP